MTKLLCPLPSCTLTTFGSPPFRTHQLHIEHHMLLTHGIRVTRSSRAYWRSQQNAVWQAKHDRVERELEDAGKQHRKAVRESMANGELPPMGMAVEALRDALAGLVDVEDDGEERAVDRGAEARATAGVVDEDDVDGPVLVHENGKAKYDRSFRHYQVAEGRAQAWTRREDAINAAKTAAADANKVNEAVSAILAPDGVLIGWSDSVDSNETLTNSDGLSSDPDHPRAQASLKAVKRRERLGARRLGVDDLAARIAVNGNRVGTRPGLQLRAQEGVEKEGEDDEDPMDDVEDEDSMEDVEGEDPTSQGEGEAEEDEISIPSSPPLPLSLQEQQAIEAVGWIEQTLQEQTTMSSRAPSPSALRPAAEEDGVQRPISSSPTPPASRQRDATGDTDARDSAIVVSAGWEEFAYLDTTGETDEDEEEEEEG